MTLLWRRAMHRFEYQFLVGSISDGSPPVRCRRVKRASISVHLDCNPIHGNTFFLPLIRLEFRTRERANYRVGERYFDPLILRAVLVYVNPTQMK